MTIGDRVMKKKGYRFEGMLLSIFEIPAGYPKAGVKMGNVIHDDGWVMHFQMNDLVFVRENGGIRDDNERSRPDRRGA